MTNLWTEIQKIEGGSEFLDSLNVVLSFVSANEDIRESEMREVDPRDHVEYDRAKIDIMLSGETTMDGVEIISSIARLETIIDEMIVKIKGDE